MTNSKNELYEDKDGSIYVSADKKGIYKITFQRFQIMINNWLIYMYR